jgi:hypothetical protein
MTTPNIETEVLEDVFLENDLATHKHGWERTCANPNLDLGSKLGILGEEFGEVCKATTYDEGDEVELYDELTQLANVALTWATCVRRQIAQKRKTKAFK